MRGDGPRGSLGRALDWCVSYIRLSVESPTSPPFFALHGSPHAEVRAVDVAPHAKDTAPAEALWDACADLAGLPRGL